MGIIGVRRLFPGEGKNFPGGGGQKPTFCLKNNKKDTIFPGQGGQEPPLPSPADAHDGHIFI